MTLSTHASEHFNAFLFPFGFKSDTFHTWEDGTDLLVPSWSPVPFLLVPLGWVGVMVLEPGKLEVVLASA